MKIWYLIFLLIAASPKVFCQDTLTYNDIITNKYKKSKNYTEFKYYKDKNGFTFKRGDKLKVLNPENSSNVSQDLWGKKLYGNFTYLFKQKGLVLTIEKPFSGEEIEIDNIYIFNLPIFKKVPAEVYFECRLYRTIDGLNSIHV